LDLFEKIRSRLMLEGHKFAYVDYVDAFVGGLKGEIKSLVKLFKPVTIDEAFDYALHVEETVECQSKKFKGSSKFPIPVVPNPSRSAPDKTSSYSPHKPVFVGPNKALIEQRRALGQCFKCGEMYFPGHQCKVKVQMLISQDEEVLSRELGTKAKSAENPVETETEMPEEAIVSMHAITNNPRVNTMRFKRFIGTTPITTLIDSGSTHSFVNPAVLKEQNCQLVDTHPMIVMVANGDRMVTDSKCQSLSFCIQGTEFSGDLRLLPVQGYDVILGLDWLGQWGDMKINWKDKWLQFKKDDQVV
jgi:Retroviral aspartyl protease